MHFDGTGLERQAALLAASASRLRAEQRALVAAAGALPWRSPAATAFGRESAVLLMALSTVSGRLDQLAATMQAHARTAQHRAIELEAAAHTVVAVLRRAAP